MENNFRKKFVEYVIITLGNFLVAAGMYFFLMPNNLAAGGVNGLGIIINSYFPSFPVGALMLIMNGILFIVAFIVIGTSFGSKTIYASLSLSGIILIFEKYWPINKPLTEDLLVELIFGILIAGIGMAIVFYQNASTGGTDIIAKIINKFLHINIGKALLLSDFSITLLAGITFGPRIGMYATLGVILNSFVIDSVIEGFNVCKEVVIISSKSEEIKKFIMEQLGRGATIYTAKGAYTEKSKEVITTVLDNREFIRLKIFIKEIDKNAFLTIKNVHEALGEGFRDIND